MSYPKELKIALVREYEQGKSVAEISKARGIPENSIYRWIREYQSIKTANSSFTPSDHNKLLLHASKMEHMLEIVRMSGYIIVVPLKKRLETAETIYHAHGEYSVREICEALSASGKPYDNAVAESFFSIIKKEELYRHQYRSVHDFQESVANYIDYYNNTRVHSFLGYLSPVQFEAKFSEKNDNGWSI